MEAHEFSNTIVQTNRTLLRQELRFQSYLTVFFQQQEQCKL